MAEKDYHLNEKLSIDYTLLPDGSANKTITVDRDGNKDTKEDDVIVSLYTNTDGEVTKLTVEGNNTDGHIKKEFSNNFPDFANEINYLSAWHTKVEHNINLSTSEGMEEFSLLSQDLQKFEISKEADYAKLGELSVGLFNSVAAKQTGTQVSTK